MSTSAYDNWWAQRWNWTNYSGGGTPDTYPDGSGDTARFTGDGDGDHAPFWNVLPNSNHLELQWLRFETTACAAYTISAQTGSSNNLIISAGGGVFVDSGVTTDQMINMTLRPQNGTTTYTNNGTGMLTFNGGMQSYWSPTPLNAEVKFDGSGDIQAGALRDRDSARYMTVIKQGSGTLTLTGANTLSGLVSVNEGTLAITGTGAGASTFGDELHVGYVTGDTAALNVSGGTTTVAGDFRFGEYGTGTITQTDGDLSVDRLVSGRFSGGTGIYNMSDGVLNVAGAGWATLAGTGTFTQTGGTVTIGGTYNVTSSTLSAGKTGTLNLNGGTFTTNGLAEGNGNAVVTMGGGTLRAGGTFVTTVDITTSGPSVSTFDTNGNDLTLNGTVTGDGDLQKIGTGTLVLSGGGTMSGDLTVAGGTVQLGADNGISTSAGLDIFGGAAATRVFDLNSYDQTLSRFGFSAVNSDGNLTITGGASSTLTINAAENTLLGQSGTTDNRITPARTVTTDMSGLGGFVWNGGSDYYFEVGPRGQNRTGGTFDPGTATVVLADNNTITGSQIRVGANGMNNHGGSSFLRLGETNVLNADIINIGASSRSNATLDFHDDLTGTPSVTIRGTDGSSAVTSWDVGRVAAVYNPAAWTSTVDFSDGELDARVTTLRIGRADTGGSSNRAGIENATFSMGKGMLEVGTLIIGQYTGGGGIWATYAGNGTFTLNDADGIVKAETVILADNTGTANNGGTRASTSGTFNLTAGTLEAKSIGKGADTGNAGSVTREFNFTSGTIRNYADANLTIANVPINLTGSGTRIFETTPGQSITVASSSAISGTDQGFTKIGDGTLILAGANTYTGATHINAGTLQINSTGALDGTSSISLADGTTLRKSGSYLDNASIDAPITVGADGTTVTIELNEQPASGGTTTTLTFNGAIGGDGNVTFQNTAGVNPRATFILNAENDYAGSTLLTSTNTNSNVLIKLGTENALPTTTVLTLDGGNGTGSGRQTVLDLNGFDQTLAGLTNVSRSLRTQRVRNTGATLATLTVDNDSDYTFSGELGTDGTHFGLTKNGSGMLTLSGANTYTGGTILNQGGITLGNGATLGSGPLQVNNTNPGASTDVLLTLPTGADFTVGSLSGTRSTPASGTNTATIQTQGGRTFIVNQTADGTYDGVISGTGNLTLGASSTHTLTLTGDNTYTGITTTDGGTLLVNGSVISPITVNAGTLGGSGTITGDVVVGSGGKLSPGNSPGTLTIVDGDLDLTAVAPVSLIFEFTSSPSDPYDQVVLADGTLIIDDLGFAGFAFSSSGTLQRGTYVLFETSNVIDGYLDANDVLGYIGASYATLDIVGTDLVLTVLIPEPSTAILAGLGLACLTFRRRRPVTTEQICGVRRNCSEQSGTCEDRR